METAQQHEWVNWRHVELGESQETCQHCGCIKVWDAIEGIFYQFPGSVELLPSEPICITRTKQPDDGKTQSDT